MFPHFQVMAQGQRSGRSDRTVDPQLLKMALAPHPKLRAALFPAVPRGNGPPSDISVYHLLQVNAHPSPASLLVFTSLLWVFLTARWCFLPVPPPSGPVQAVWLAGSKHPQLHR